jgi:hypothetical protein
MRQTRGGTSETGKPPDYTKPAAEVEALRARLFARKSQAPPQIFTKACTPIAAKPRSIRTRAVGKILLQSAPCPERVRAARLGRCRKPVRRIRPFPNLRVREGKISGRVRRHYRRQRATQYAEQAGPASAKPNSEQQCGCAITGKKRTIRNSFTSDTRIRTVPIDQDKSP